MAEVAQTQCNSNSPAPPQTNGPMYQPPVARLAAAAATFARDGDCADAVIMLRRAAAVATGACSCACRLQLLRMCLAEAAGLVLHFRLWLLAIVAELRGSVHRQPIFTNIIIGMRDLQNNGGDWTI